MLSFGTGFVLGSLFRDNQKVTEWLKIHRGNPREKSSVESWWEFHTSCLYADVENECVKKWALKKGYDLKAHEHIIRALVHSYKVYAEVLDMMLECAKEKKKKAKKWKSWIKRKEARLLIKMIKKYQKAYKRRTR